MSKKVDGYEWIVADGRTAYCRMCATTRPTYGEIKENAVWECCQGNHVISIKEMTEDQQD